MSATDARQNFGQFLDYGIQEPVLIKRQKRDLGVFLPMALYRRLIAAENRKITQSVEALQAEAGVGGLSEETLDSSFKRKRARVDPWLFVTPQAAAGAA